MLALAWYIIQQVLFWTVLVVVSLILVGVVQKKYFNAKPLSGNAHTHGHAVSASDERRVIM
jgi:hypothetical protein